ARGDRRVRALGGSGPQAARRDLRGRLRPLCAHDRGLGRVAGRPAAVQRGRLALMRRNLRLAAAVLVVLLGSLALVAIIERDWTSAQLRAIAILSITEDVPVLAWTARVVTAEPRVEETTVSGAPSTVVRPDGGGPWPAIVFVNGATRRGRHHPKVQRLARGLARTGFLVVVPDLPALRLRAIT